VNHAGHNPPNLLSTNAVAIIPARFASTRLPGKALVEIAGKPMVCWVAERALAARNVSRVIVATDNQKIFDVVQRQGIEVALTDEGHANGTDRIAQVAATLSDAEIIVNVQGDEPLISPATIERAVEALISEGPSGAGIVTTWELIDSKADLFNPNLVKIVVSDDGFAVYFSRSPIPYPRDAIRRHGSPEAAFENEPELLKLFRKHTGLYVYRKDVLLKLTKWPQTQLERTEALEQLRALEHGVRIRAIETSSPSTGVDTFEDLERVRELVRSGKICLSAVL
jgi:3-deoxy-manno-octulosonate cytidylyltransferase (CMP-KDO synthetase)